MVHFSLPQAVDFRFLATAVFTLLTFSFDDFDSMLDAAASAVPSSGSSLVRPPSLLAASSSASSSTHGESSAFVDICASLMGNRWVSVAGTRVVPRRLLPSLPPSRLG